MVDDPAQYWEKRDDADYKAVRDDIIEQCARVAEGLDPDRLVCVNGHDRCNYGPDEECPYCEIRSPIAAAIRALKDKQG